MGVKVTQPSDEIRGKLRAAYDQDTAQLIDAEVLGAQSLVARAQIEPEPFELGAFATLRVGTNEDPAPDNEPDHFWAGGADAKIDATFPALVVAGFLVGIGTRYGAGCTSGHGVCGVSRLSPRSIVATIVFMTAGFVTVYAIRHIVGA